MCGIAGAIAVDAALDVAFDVAHDPDATARPAGETDASDPVARATRSLAHRGPDEEGLWVSPDGRCRLGHRRLSIIDVAHGQQPLFNEDRSVACIFNGEIYNFESLRGELIARGHRFRTGSDGEAIAHLWEEEGERLLGRLRGMFAIALWDSRTRRLLLARDRLGKKPLVWGLVAGELVFASELNALRAGWGAGELDLDALEAFLALGAVPAPLSIERRYRKLPPASYLIAEPGRAPRVERYWDPRALPKLDVSREQAVELVRAKLDESVRIRLMSEVPLGLFLSGGVDSSAVLASMARVSPVPVKTFSIGFDDAALDESRWARAAARAVGAEHHELEVKPDSLDILERVLGQYGEPFADSSCLPTWVLARLAREHVTVALTGDGGDELFAGYPRFAQIVRLGRAAALLPASGLRLAERWLPHRGRWRRLGRAAELLSLDPAGRDFELCGVFGDRLRRELLAPLGRPGGAGKAHVRDAYARSDGGELDRLLGTELRTYLPDDLLVKMDIACMAHGLEARSPLLDHELVELCCRLPESWKLDGRRAKALLKDVAAPSFPPGFLERPKMGFAPPLKRWIRDDVDGFFAAELRNGALARSGLVAMPVVERLLAEERAGLANHQHRLFALVSLSLFLAARGA